MFTGLQPQKHSRKLKQLEGLIRVPLSRAALESGLCAGRDPFRITHRAHFCSLDPVITALRPLGPPFPRFNCTLRKINRRGLGKQEARVFNQLFVRWGDGRRLRCSQTPHLCPHTVLGPFRIQRWVGVGPLSPLGQSVAPSVPEGAKSCVSSGPQAPADRPPRSAFPKRRGSNREHLQEGSQGGSGPQGIPGFPFHPDLWSFGNKEAISGPLKSREKPMLLTMPRTYHEASTVCRMNPGPPGTEAGSGLAPALGPAEAHGPPALPAALQENHTHPR